ANWRQFAAATAAAISLLRALLGPVLDRLWKHQEEDNLHLPRQTIVLKYPGGQKRGRGYYYDLYHTCSVACKLQSPGTAMLPAPSKKVKKNRG
ncbi:hypothetical protein N312_08593, partial [Balearica regulorum gibbericeps]